MLPWLVWIACSTPSAPPYDGSWVDFEAAPATGLHTRFKGQDAWDPAPADAFALRDACPRVTRARVKPFTETMRWLDLEGERLATVELGAAKLPDGKYASIKIEPHADGSLGLPVACEACEILLVFSAPNGKWVACEGPSRAVWVSDRPGLPLR